MGSRRDIEFILKTELEVARERCRVTLENMKTMADGAGDGNAAVDGSAARKPADKAENVAVRAYGEALQRFHNFILHGAIPSDLLFFDRAETPEWRTYRNKDGGFAE
jgi:hypothetical protein